MVLPFRTTFSVRRLQEFSQPRSMSGSAENDAPACRSVSNMRRIQFGDEAKRREAARFDPVMLLPAAQSAALASADSTFVPPVLFCAFARPLRVFGRTRTMCARAAEVSEVSRGRHSESARDKREMRVSHTFGGSFRPPY